MEVVSGEETAERASDPQGAPAAATPAGSALGLFAPFHL